jgi:hypothetical protein
MIFHLFQAIAFDDFGQYDASFTLSYPKGKVSQDEVNSTIQYLMKEFETQHPNGKIVNVITREAMMI